MADNDTYRDYGGTSVLLRMSDDGTAKAAVIVSEMLSPTATLTRDVNTTVYSANDAVTNSTSAPVPLTFAGMARATGMGGLIVGAKLLINEKNGAAAEFHLWLFSVSPTANNDNAVFAPIAGDLTNVVGVLIFTPANMSDGTGMRVYQAVNAPISYRCATTSLYGLLQTRTAYTPVASKTHQFILDVVKET